jgi:hypothetical protein
VGDLTVELHERYRRNALSYCIAAAKLDSEESSDFIAPISLCLAFAVELYLKCVLLKAGKTAEELSRKPFGHDLWSMWNMPELATQRNQASLRAQSCFQDLSRDESLTRVVPEPNTFERFLEDLSKLHTSASGMALRYPTQRTRVPDSALMISVFEDLIRAEQWGEEIKSVC